MREEERRGTRKLGLRTHTKSWHLICLLVTKNTEEAAVTATQLNRIVQVHRKRKPGLDDARGSQQNRI